MADGKRVLFLEGYYGGSHRAFADGWRDRSRHAVRILSLPARKWKWRMQTGAWLFAEELAREGMERPYLIFATDMVNLAEFLGLARRHVGDVPAVLYFHENQYSYPEQVAGRSDFSWGVVNTAAALAADRLVFNSAFHRRDFFRHVRRGVGKMPDGEIGAGRIDGMERGARVIAPGVDFGYFDRFGAAAGARGEARAPLILWNHRWEHDKGPEAFFEALEALRDAGVAFRLAVCGERFAAAPGCFEEARERFADEIEVFGFLPERDDYARLLWEADVVVSTARQEFLGLSVVEAMWCGCYPLLPDRLNYPYLLPEALHGAHLYGEGELGARMVELLSRGTRPRALWGARAAFLEGCGWDVVAMELDGLVDEVGR